MTDYSQKPADSLFVDAKATPITEEEVAFYLSKFWKKIFGVDITKEQLGCIWSHTVLETGRGLKYSYHWNIGNIKKIKGQKYTSYKCNEVIDGKAIWFEPYHPQTLFAAWDTAEAGFEHYLRFLTKSRYANTLKALKAGKIEQYSKELKAAGYYTASEQFYTAALIKINKEFMKKAARLMSYTPPEPEPAPSVIIPEPTPQALKPIAQPITLKPPAMPKLQPMPKSKWSWLVAVIDFLKSLLQGFKK